MLQSLLKNRFGLVFHEEQKLMNAYVLRLKKANVLKGLNAEIGDIHTSRGPVLRLSGNLTMPYFAGLLSNMLDRPVADMTELKGVYKVDLEWSDYDTAGSPSNPVPSLSAALEDRMGIRLQVRKTVVDLYVIDHIDRLPTEN
jgi:uncharacterized protein (TIGR03435 family)